MIQDPPNVRWFGGLEASSMARLTTRSVPARLSVGSAHG